MLVDIETKRPLEIEAIVGEVVRAGREHGVDIPVSIAPKINHFIDLAQCRINTDFGDGICFATSCSSRTGQGRVLIVWFHGAVS